MLFKKIGLYAKHSTKSTAETFEKLIRFLLKREHSLIIEEQSAGLLKDIEKDIPKETAKEIRKSSDLTYTTTEKTKLGEHCDLVIVLGGDGSLLNAARSAVDFKVPILGINRGRLGFLADILPTEMETELNAILEGKYTAEKRSLLLARVLRDDKEIASQTALNEVVLYTGNIARMIDFEVNINNQFVSRQQADGIITATPTGSTAYALSAHGPILYPTLNAITLVPLCPHTLSSRPIVIEDNSKIEIIVEKINTHNPKLGCDGQIHIDLIPGDRILIEKYAIPLTLIHPLHHDYFSVLREKLGWSIPAIKE